MVVGCRKCSPKIITLVSPPAVWALCMQPVEELTLKPAAEFEAGKTPYFRS